MNTVNWTLWLALALTYCILTYNPLYHLALLATLSAVAASKHKPLRAYMKIGLLMSAIPLFVNVFLVHYGDTTLYKIPLSIHVAGLRIPTLFFAGPITGESVLMGIIMAVFLMNTVVAFQIFSSGATQDAILNIMPKSMPAVTLLASISFRFMPAILRDYATIRDAQMSRGIRLGSGPTMERMRNQAKMITPTIVTSLERAFNLAESMAARGYTGERRVYRKDVWNLGEYVLAAAIALGFTIALYAKYAGLFAYWPVDSLILPPVSWLAVAPLIVLLIPLVVTDERD